MEPIDVQVGDIVRLRKPHPCGGYEWEVERIGADIRVRCLTCGARVMMPRRKFERSLKMFVRRIDAEKKEDGSGSSE